MKYLITTIAALVLVGCGPSVDIHEAAYEGNIEAVKQHLAAGTDVNKRIWNDVLQENITPLDSANLSASDNQNEVVNILKKHGGKADAWFNAHESIHKAAIGGNIEVLKQHLAAGGDVNAKAEGGGTPSHLAAYAGHKEIAKLLIAKGANVNAQHEGGGTALDMATFSNHNEIVDLLRKHGGKTRKQLEAAGN